MSKFILAYHNGDMRKPASPEEGAKMMGKWKDWVSSLGDAMVNPGTPLGKSKTVSPTGITDGGGSNPLSGYSILEAENIDAATEVAKGSPHVEYGGTIEVAEMMEMKPNKS